MNFTYIVNISYRCFISLMSAEKNLEISLNNLPPLKTSQISGEVKSGRVDINVLLNRARKAKNKEFQTNLVFIGLTLCLIFIVGIILSF